MRGTLAIGIVALAACRDLTALPHDVCGNGVVEPGEDCDSAADPALGQNLSCVAAEQPAACRYSCAAASCPVGWACGDDHVCRHASGEIQLEAPVALAHDELAIADVDGDRLGDLVAFSMRGAQVMYADRSVLVVNPDPLSGPGFARDLDGDDIADIVTPVGQGLTVGRGERDRTVTPVSYGAFSPGPGSWFIPLRVPLANEADALAALVTNGNGTDATVFLVPSGLKQHAVPLASDITPSMLASVAVRGDFDAPSAEDELVVAAPGRAWLWQLRPKVSLFGQLAFEVTTIAIDEGLADGRVLAVDYDVDGDLDVLAGVGDGVVLAHNDGGLTSAAPIADFDPLGQPGNALPDVPSSPQEFPLAVGDLDDDGTLDAVSPDAVFAHPGGPLEPIYRRSTNAPWREAVIADVDGDQRLDVIVASEHAGLDVLRNKPTGFTRIGIVTAGPVSMLRVGDFDGDGVDDVAFRERTDRDRVRVLFGTFGLFAPPVAAIGLPAIDRLEVGRFRDNRGEDDAADDLVLVGNDGVRPGSSFVAGSGDRRMRSGLFLSDGNRVDSPLAAAAGNFAGGDHTELAVLARSPEGQRRIWLFGAPAGLAYRVNEAVRAPVFGTLATLDVIRFAAGDLDGDGRAELVVLGREPSGASALALVTLNGSEPPAITTIDPQVGDAVDLAIGDVDHDGRDEVFVAGAAGIARWQHDMLTTVAGGCDGIALGQLDDDPELELASIAGDALTLWDASALDVARTWSVPRASHVRAGDIDGDGVTDLVLGDGFTVTRVHSVPQVAR